jgi:NTE family protein
LNGIGLVLAGGGGKGAYQIGVWKYLREAGLDKSVCAVSGTSVGALNAALFAAGDFRRAERIWRNMKPELILSPASLTEKDVLEWLSESGIQPSSYSRPLPPAAEMAPAIFGVIKQAAPFSREGLLHLMREGVDFGAIRNAPFPCFATCLRTPNFKVCRFDLREYAPDEAQTILLASSAIPVVFQNVAFRGEAYCDGGVPFLGDNTPVAPVAALDVKYIIVVHLMRDVLIDRRRYPGAKLIEITPQSDLGGLMDGTLDFSADGAARRMEQGYEDTKKALGGFVDAALIHRQNEMIFQAFEESERRYQDRVNMLKAQRTGALSRGREAFEEMMEEFSQSGELPDNPGMDLEALQEGVPVEDDALMAR